MAVLFLKLGMTGFGGPAAHIAMMHDDAVKRRRWLSDQECLDLVGATNLIPGPNSTEMAIHIGFLRAGWLGLIVGGACFILPAMLIVMALAWFYVQIGSTPRRFCGPLRLAHRPTMDRCHRCGSVAYGMASTWLHSV